MGRLTSDWSNRDAPIDGPADGMAHRFAGEWTGDRDRRAASATPEVASAPRRSPQGDTGGPDEDRGCALPGTARRAESGSRRDCASPDSRSSCGRRSESPARCPAGSLVAGRTTLGEGLLQRKDGAPAPVIPRGRPRLATALSARSERSAAARRSARGAPRVGAAPPCPRTEFRRRVPVLTPLSARSIPSTCRVSAAPRSFTQRNFTHRRTQSWCRPVGAAPSQGTVPRCRGIRHQD